MNIAFYKYQGTGNDFILIDNRDKSIVLSTEQIAQLCHRRFGIGADGLMLLENETGYDFRMVYYNADGNESTMCGNGGRCITAFAHSLGVVKEAARFIAIDGAHTATIENGIVNLQMQDVKDIDTTGDRTIMNTGSPHYVQWVDDVQATDVFNNGRSIRTAHSEKGINVNFVQKLADAIWVRTYERGVEDETLSCGTGVTASAIAASGDKTGSFTTAIHTPGGDLTVSFIKDSANSATDVYLKGPAVFVYEGVVNVNEKLQLK